jgi:hypothetical protein
MFISAVLFCFNSAVSLAAEPRKPNIVVILADDLGYSDLGGETEPVPIETGKLGGKLARYENMRVNPAKSIGFSAVEAAARIRIPALFVVAEKEELSNNATVEEVHKEVLKRGVPSSSHVIKDITH